MKCAFVLLLAAVCVHGQVFDTLEEALLTEVQYSGYITTQASIGANLFYWFFESRNDPTTDPVILWMTGGPGCSGELAVFQENGPFKLTPQLQLVTNPYSWNNNATVIYIDQPYGTGFSYVDSSSDYISDETEMADDMYIFLEKWFAMYPQFQSNDFFIIGESYGGHYVPALSNKVIEENNSGSSSIKINFQGCGIGNGMVDPYYQFPQYGVFAYDNNLISESQYAQLNKTADECQSLISSSNYYEAYETCLPIISDVLGWTDINPYDINLKCNPEFPLCYNFTAATDYLNLPATQQALGVDREWAVCNFAVNGDFTSDWVEEYASDVANVLANGFPVLIYSGTLDFICNWYGGAAWTANLDWPNQSAWDAVEMADWHYTNGTVIGTYKQLDMLTFVGVYNAGHMVPMNQPLYSEYLLELFLNGQPLS